MLTTGLLLLRERLDAHLGRRPGPPADRSPEAERARERHCGGFVGSDPGFRQHRYDRTREPWRHLDYYRALRGRLTTGGVQAEDARVDLDGFSRWLDRFGLLRRYYRLFGDVRIEVPRALPRLARARSPARRHLRRHGLRGLAMARLLRRQGVRGHCIDLINRPGMHRINIGADVMATGLPDGFVLGVSALCAFELFSGDGDRRFFTETAWILAPGGRAAIMPLYLDDFHFVLHSPHVPQLPDADEPGAVRFWRDNAAKAPYSRHYSPEAFDDRIASQLPPGLSGRMVSATNLDELMAG